MRKRVVMFLAILLLLASVCWPAAEAHAAMMNLQGSCTLSVSGKSVTFSGRSTSSTIEDTIQVTVSLWEQRNGTWYEISSVSKTKQNTMQVTASKTVTVSGGYYYKVTAVHFSQTGSTSHTTYSSTSSRWIPS